MKRISRCWFVPVLTASVALLPLPSRAQDTDPLERLDARTRASVLAVIDSARSLGLPVEPLVQKALEGHSKGADAQAIPRAVSSLAHRLESARRELGGSATPAELVAGASALYVGLPDGTLGRLRAARKDGSLAMPLVALTFFVRRGLASDASIDLVESLVSAQVTDTELLRLQQSIETDIRAGAAPAAASRTRVDALLSRTRLR